MLDMILTSVFKNIQLDGLMMIKVSLMVPAVLRSYLEGQTELVTSLLQEIKTTAEGVKTSESSSSLHAEEEDLPILDERILAQINNINLFERNIATVKDTVIENFEENASTEFEEMSETIEEDFDDCADQAMELTIMYAKVYANDLQDRLLPHLENCFDSKWMESDQAIENVIEILTFHYGAWAESVNKEVYLRHLVKASLPLVVEAYLGTILKKDKLFTPSKELNEAMRRDEKVITEFYCDTYGDLVGPKWFKTTLAPFKIFTACLSDDLGFLSGHFVKIPTSLANLSLKPAEVMMALLKKRDDIKNKSDLTEVLEDFYVSQPSQRPAVTEKPNISPTNLNFTKPNVSVDFSEDAKKVQEAMTETASAGKEHLNKLAGTMAGHASVGFGKASAGFGKLKKIKVKGFFGIKKG